MGGSTVQDLLRAWLKVSAADRFDEATRRPREAQRQKLLEIVRRGARTAFGEAHGLGAVRSVEDFRAAVPVQTYETLEPYVDRVLHGEADVLTAGRPLMFATTSGTTGSAKYIPLTRAYLNEYAHGVHVHTYRIFADHPDILAGRVLVSSSSDVEGHAPSGVPYGAISGYLARTQPRPIRRFYALPYELCKVKQVEAKYYLTLRHALAADVRLVVAPNPSSLLLLAEKLDLWAESLIRDVRNGGVNPDFLPADAAADLTRGLRSDPARARDLDTLRRHGGRLLPAEAWPNLRLLSCWKGGTMPLYLRELPRLWGDCPIRDLGYMASEGRAATPLVNAGAGGVLNVTSHFFEFVPVEERDSSAPTFLTAEELEPDREYYIYFTTSAGLYRYDINDVVRVVDFYRETPVIQFVRKGQGISSITGEKLTESQVTAAVMETVEAGDFDVRHFTACVKWADPPFYALYAELGDSMTRDRCMRFVERFDAALRVGNVEYDAKRESQRLGPPVLRRVAPGSYQQLRERRVAEGAPEAQVKLPQLATRMEFGDDLVVLEEIGFREQLAA